MDKPIILAEEKIEKYTILIEQWAENERGVSITDRLQRVYLSSEEARILFDFLLRHMGKLDGTSL